MADEKPVAIFGAGAVGSFLGAVLEASGISVLLFGRERVLGPMRTGLTLLTPDGMRRTFHPEVRTELDDRKERVSLVLLTVKAFSVENSVEALESLLTPDGVVVSFQNGVGSDEILIERFGRSRVVAGTSTVSVGLEEPGTVQQYTDGGGVAVSPYGNALAAKRVHGVLTRTEVPTELVDDPRSLKWSKLLLNAIGAAQSTILQVDVGTIASSQELFRIEQQAFRETVKAMRAEGIRISDLPGYRVRAAALAMGLPPAVARRLLSRRISGGRGGKLPSMAFDSARGGPTENCYLNGAVSEAARRAGLSAPVNTALAKIVDEVTSSPESREQFSGNYQALLERVARAESGIGAEAV